MERPSRKPGFTLVELLVVITIIAILIALLLPAVQAAREAARKTQCAKNVKEMALAALNHEQAHGHLPSGGWGYGWVGDPRYGVDELQPGGWFYNILPFLEQQDLHDLSLKATSDTDRMNLTLAMIQKPLLAYSCPTRRPPVLFPVRPDRNWFVNASKPADLTAGWTKADYADNGGEEVVMWGYGPGSWSDGLAGIGFQSKTILASCTGVAYQRSKIRMADITDGASNTYLVGEKYLDFDYYYSGECYGDDESVFGGDDLDLNRWTSVLPHQDTPGIDDCYAFGSAHSTSFNMGFCDGSVQAINYSIDATIHRHLGNRADGLAVDSQKGL